MDFGSPASPGGPVFPQNATHSPAMSASTPTLGGPSQLHSPSTGTRMSMRPRMPSFAGREPQTLAEMAYAKSQPQTPLYNERSTRSKTTKPKLASKVKLKLGEKATLGIGNSFLGPYDRELDTEDEDDQDLVFEEQFILKMPPGDDCDRLRAMVQARAVTSDVWFKLKDSRRGVFHIGDHTYSAKLVDLPAIVEAQKTLDGKQMFKVADICQALVVEHQIEDEDDYGGSSSKTFNINDFIWPHGITPPLRHVRKRRFRKRIGRAAIEIVEQEIERLLELDSQAKQVEYKVLENVNPDLSDREFESDPGDGGSQEGDEFFDPMATPAGATPAGWQMDDGMDEQEADGDEGSEDDLAAELERALAGEEEQSGEDDDDEEEDEEETDEEYEEDEDAELTQAKRLLSEEIRDLEAAVEKKIAEISSAGNPIIKRRFEDALKKLKGDLEAKRTQYEALITKPLDEEGLEVDGAEDDIDDLFGDDDDEEEADPSSVLLPTPSPQTVPERATDTVVIQLPSN